MEIQSVPPNAYVTMDDNQVKKSNKLFYNNSADTISRGVIAVSLICLL